MCIYVIEMRMSHICTKYAYTYTHTSLRCESLLSDSRKLYVYTYTHTYLRCESKICIFIHAYILEMRKSLVRFKKPICTYSQSHLGWHFRKFKAQSSNVSFATFLWKQTFELWALSFETAFENATPSGIGCTYTHTYLRCESRILEMRRSLGAFKSFLSVRDLCTCKSLTLTLQEFLSHLTLASVRDLHVHMWETYMYRGLLAHSRKCERLTETYVHVMWYVKRDLHVHMCKCERLTCTYVCV